MKIGINLYRDRSDTSELSELVYTGNDLTYDFDLVELSFAGK